MYMAEKMKTFVITLVIFTGIIAVCHGQNDSTDLIYKIKKEKPKVTVLPEGYELYMNTQNLIFIKADAGIKISKVELTGGKIYKRDSLNKKDSAYYAVTDNGTQALLSVYEKLPDGREQVCLTKPYVIIEIPEPVVRVDNVEHRNTVQKKTIIALGNIEVVSYYFKRVLPVIYFEMQTSGGSQIDTLRSNSSKLTKEMKDVIEKGGKEGSIAYFKNIKCLLPNGSILSVKPVEIFIDDSPIYMIGM